MSKLTKLLKKEQKLLAKIASINAKIDSYQGLEVDYLEKDIAILIIDLVDIRKELKDLLIIELARLIHQ